MMLQGARASARRSLLTTNGLRPRKASVTDQASACKVVARLYGLRSVRSARSGPRLGAGSSRGAEGFGPTGFASGLGFGPGSDRQQRGFVRGVGGGEQRSSLDRRQQTSGFDLEGDGAPHRRAGGFGQQRLRAAADRQRTSVRCESGEAPGAEDFGPLRTEAGSDTRRASAWSEAKGFGLTPARASVLSAAEGFGPKHRKWSRPQTVRWERQRGDELRLRTATQQVR